VIKIHKMWLKLPKSWINRV
jgi:uncharacterized protein YjbI with pentapeptide repeats